MGEIRSPHPVKLFTGVLTSIPEIAPKAEQRLTALFGPVDSRSERFLFDLTDYYNETMGTPIYRYFISFEKLIEPSAIAGAKVQTNELECAFSPDYPQLQRPINLDPGYLEQSKIVLASTKNFYHRILISGGIYAEVTLHFEEGAWQTLPWTFPDYKTSRYHQYFSSLRDIYRNQLSRMGVRIKERGRGIKESRDRGES
jgi:Domain of unknown function (DUF4416)